QMQDGGGHVGQRGPLRQYGCRRVAPVGDDHQRDRVGGVSAVGPHGAVRCLLGHAFGIAVVADGEDPSATVPGRLQDLLHRDVGGLAGGDGGGEVAGVSDHVDVGQVGDDQIDVRARGGFDHGRGDAVEVHPGTRDVVGLCVAGDAHVFL